MSLVNAPASFQSLKSVCLEVKHNADLNVNLVYISLKCSLEIKLTNGDVREKSLLLKITTILWFIKKLLERTAANDNKRK